MISLTSMRSRSSKMDGVLCCDRADGITELR